MWWLTCGTVSTRLAHTRTITNTQSNTSKSMLNQTDTSSNERGHQQGTICAQMLCE